MKFPLQHLGHGKRIEREMHLGADGVDGQTMVPVGHIERILSRITIGGRTKSAWVLHFAKSACAFVATEIVSF